MCSIAGSDRDRSNCSAITSRQSNTWWVVEASILLNRRTTEVGKQIRFQRRTRSDVATLNDIYAPYLAAHITDINSIGVAVTVGVFSTNIRWDAVLHSWYVNHEFVNSRRSDIIRTNRVQQRASNGIDDINSHANVIASSISALVEYVLLSRVVTATKYKHRSRSRSVQNSRYGHARPGFAHKFKPETSA